MHNFDPQKMAKFSELIQSDIPVLIDFYADWCGPCKMVSPIVQEVAKETKGNARVLKINVDNNQTLSQKLNIKGVPTLMIYKKGELKWRQAGVVSKTDLLQILKQFY